MNNHSHASTSQEEKLIRSGGLHPDDLAFNQAGELSPRQKRWLTFEVAAWGVQIGIDLILVICAWLFYYFQFRHNLQAFVIGGLLWSFALGMSVLICLEHARPLWADIQGGEVKSISGIISKYYGYGAGLYLNRRTRRRGPVNWGVKIRERGFSVYPRVYAALVAHQTYRLFYLPNTERIMNIDPLFQAHAEKQSALAALQARAKEGGVEQ